MERHQGSEQHRGRPGAEGGKSLSREDALRLILTTLEGLRATDAERFRTILTAYAESDFDPYAKHPVDDTWGLFQQNPKWWGTRAQILDPAYATASFVVGRPDLPSLRRITLTRDPVVDCWRVQKWGRGISPDRDMAEFLAHPSTQNYSRRLDTVAQIVKTGRLP